MTETEEVLPCAPHLLVVDDDTELRGLLHRFLTRDGFRVTAAADAREARERMAAFRFDLLIVDVMMPGESGIDLVRTLRQEGATPVLILTAMGEVEDRVGGLQAGADDYLTKPFEPRELVLRVRSILRRRGEGDGAWVVLGDCRFDRARAILWRNETRIRLTTAEAALLTVLVAQPGQVLSREALTRACGMAGDVRAVDVHVVRLRRKIEVDARTPLYLQTVRGSGYVLYPDRQE